MSDDAPVVAATARETTLDRLVFDHPLWKNPRTVTGLDAKSLDDLAEDIHQHGQISPITVVRVWGHAPVVVDDATGEAVMQGERPIDELVIDGQRRGMALTKYAKDHKKGLRTVTVKVMDFYPEPIEMDEETSKQLYLDMVRAATRRKSLSSFEQTEIAYKFREEDKKTNEEVASAIDRSPTWVSRMVRAYRLASPLLIKAFRDGKVTDEIFKDLSEVNPHDKQEEALAAALEGRTAGGRDAKATVRASIKEKAREAKKEKAAKKAAEPKKPSKAKAKGTGSNGKLNKAVVFDKPLKPSQIDDVLMIATKKKPPTDPYMKGLIDGMAAARSGKPPAEFEPPWTTWIQRSIGAGAIKPGDGPCGFLVAIPEKTEGAASSGKTAKRNKEGR